MIGIMQSGKASYFSNLKQPNKDIIMTNQENGEYGNSIPNRARDFPFTLNNDECVISYIDAGKTKYIKLNNIVEKQGEYSPSAPPKENTD